MTQEVSKTADLIRATSGTDGADGWYIVVCSVKGDAEVYTAHRMPGESYRQKPHERLLGPRLVGHLVSADPHIVVQVPLQVSVDDIDTVSVSVRLDITIGPDQVETFFKARSLRPVETLREWIESHVGPTLREHMDKVALAGGANALSALLVEHMGGRQLGLDTLALPALDMVAAKYGLTVNGVRITRELSEATRGKLIELARYDQEPVLAEARAHSEKKTLEAKAVVDQTRLRIQNDLARLQLENKLDNQALENRLEVRQAVVDGIKKTISNLAEEIDTPHKARATLTELDAMISRFGALPAPAAPGAQPGAMLLESSAGSGAPMAALPAAGNRLARMMMGAFAPLATVADSDPNVRRLLAALAHCVAEASLGDDADHGALRRYFSRFEDAWVGAQISPLERGALDHIRDQVRALRTATGIDIDD